jgi:hypothetical protein
MRNLLIAAVGAVTLSALVACSETSTEPTNASLSGFSESTTSEPVLGEFDPTGQGRSAQTYCEAFLDGKAGEDFLVGGKWESDDGGEWESGPDGGFGFNIHAGGSLLDWWATGSDMMRLVIVKGGEQTDYVNLYYYDGETAGQNLQTPTGQDISHYAYCYIAGEGVSGEGCSQGFWANHDGSGPQDSYWPEPYKPTDDLGGLFVIPATYHAAFESASLKDALLGGALPNGQVSQLDRAASNLFRQAVAAVLNAAHEDVVNFEFAYDDKTGVNAVVAAVNAALDEGERQAIIDLAAEFDALNNAGCPIEKD